MPKYSQIEKIQKEGEEIFRKKYYKYILYCDQGHSSFDIPILPFVAEAVLSYRAQKIHTLAITSHLNDS